jgi:[protein-PII] uridylyltransferase
VQSPERLKLLILLTVADIRAVGPGIWNGWKGQLLRSLYYETEPLVAGGHTAVERSTQILEAKELLRQALAARGWDAGGIGRFVDRQPSAYWLRTELERQVEHAHLMQREPTPEVPLIFDVRTDAFRYLTEITVYTRDHASLLAMLAGACAAAGANIASAQISTTNDGMALDTLSLQKVFDDADEVQQANKIARIATELLQGARSLDSVKIERRKAVARLEAFNVRPQVIIDNSMSDAHTVIEVNARDRSGLLFDITAAIAELGLDISSAHVATFGEKAVDVFYVTDQMRRKIQHDWRKQKLRERILAAIDNGGR